MRAVIQRVTEARVVIAGVSKGAIQTGLLVLLGWKNRTLPRTLHGFAGKLSASGFFATPPG